MIQYKLHWHVDIYSYFKKRLYISGWAFHEDYSIQGIGYLLNEIDGHQSDNAKLTYYKADGYGLESSDIYENFGGKFPDKTKNCRFSLELSVDMSDVMALQLVILFENGEKININISEAIHKKMVLDPYHLLYQKFIQLLSHYHSGQVLEIGSRNRSGVVRKSIIPTDMKYVGFDILPGDNVDVVGDAHSLSTIFSPGSFDAIFSMSVFEHLLMPWKVIIEMNRVMKTGGLVFITTHQTWPLHEVPWDFWRFSDQAWLGLFNQYTGFEIVEAVMGEPANIVAHACHPATAFEDSHIVYLGSAVLCRKVDDTQLTWNVNTQEIINTMYPSDSVSK